MIVVRLCGGLGNQMFQYATGRAVAMTTKTELVYDLGWYRRTPKSNTRREFELARYSILAREATLKEESSGHYYTGQIWRRLPLLPRPWRLFKENDYNYDPLLQDVKDNTYLYGYWQSYRYFEKIAELLRTELTPLIPPSKQDISIMNQIKDSCSVSVHVRRGDYVTKKTAANVHGVCTLDYYRSALDAIMAFVKEPHFFVFSDDSKWSRENLVFPGTATFIDHNGTVTAFQDMRLMSNCRHHIIANSSFSWWGAWLNPCSDKTVIAPLKWFADGRATNDLTPTAWLRL
jgi:hypothetical protein